MNFQVTILKVLVTYFASLADVKRDVATLATSGREPERTSRLAARLPGVEIFAQGLVARRDGGWRITEAGRSALDVMERGARGSRAVAAQVVEPEPSPPCRSASLVDRRRIGDSEPSLVPAAFGTEPPLLAAHFPAEHCNDSVAHHDRYSNIRPVPGIVMSSRTDALVSQQEAGKIAASIVLRYGRLPPSMSYQRAGRE